jgi:hypothetical protein
VESILRLVQRQGFRRGVRGGSSLWLIAGASAWMLLRERRGRSRVVYRTVLQPGEQLTVATRPPRRRNGPPAL